MPRELPIRTIRVLVAMGLHCNHNFGRLARLVSEQAIKSRRRANACLRPLRGQAPLLRPVPPARLVLALQSFKRHETARYPLCRIAGLASPAGASGRPEQISATRGLGEGKEWEESIGKGAVSGFGILGRGKTGPFRGPWKDPALKTQLDLVFRGRQVYVTGRPENENGNCGLYRQCEEK